MVYGSNILSSTTEKAGMINSVSSFRVTPLGVSYAAGGQVSANVVDAPRVNA